MKSRTFLVGLMMGAAEVVPGVSGGTIVFISRLYERLVVAIQRFTPFQLWARRSLGFKALWLELDISFLLILFGSMACSVFSLANFVGYMLEQHPVPIWAFFFGLVVASIIVVGRHLVIGATTILAICLGASMGYGLTLLSVAEAEVSLYSLFLGGCIAVCAWILPGISGSFILLILGLYQAVIIAIRDFDVTMLACVGLGCAVGLITFSRILSLLLDRFYNVTVAIMVGIMVGSLPKLWPWRLTSSYVLADDGSYIPVVQEPLLPNNYAELYGVDPSICVASLTCFIGLTLVFLMDRFALIIPGSRNGKI